MRLLWYRPLYAASEESLVRDAAQSTRYLDTIRGMRAIQLFGRQTQRLAKFDGINTHQRFQRDRDG